MTETIAIQKKFDECIDDPSRFRKYLNRVRSAVLVDNLPIVVKAIAKLATENPKWAALYLKLCEMNSEDKPDFMTRARKRADYFFSKMELDEALPELRNAAVEHAEGD